MHGEISVNSFSPQNGLSLPRSKKNLAHECFPLTGGGDDVENKGEWSRHAYLDNELRMNAL